MNTKRISMYLTIEKTAEYLKIDINEMMRLIREKQVRYIKIDDEILINQNQFTLFLKTKEKMLKELEEYLNTPLPEDIDIKDED